MFRLIWLTFWSPSRLSHEADHHVHESPKSMTVPLIVLAICSVFAGFLGVPKSLGGSNRFEQFLAPVFENHIVIAAAAKPEVEPPASKPEGTEEKSQPIE